MSDNPACRITRVKAKDEEKWDEYRSQVPATLSEWGAEVVFRGKHAEALATEQGYTHAIITRFPDDAAIRSWYEAPTYQALIPPREQAVEMVLIGYDRSPAFPSISSCRLTSGPCGASSLRGAYAGMGPTIRL